MRNGQNVAAFEKAFAEYVGAKYAIALCNGTATLHAALFALGVKEDDRVAVPPLTMSATTIAVLQARAEPHFVDVDPRTWIMRGAPGLRTIALPVSLYGLHAPNYGGKQVDDAAQALRPHSYADFTSYSFQASKILSLGEGGMLVTDDEELATKARSFSSLGYSLDPKSPRIDPAILKGRDYERHHLPVSWNYRMNDITASEGLRWLERTTDTEHGALNSPSRADKAKAIRQEAASLYREAIQGTDWITPQYVPNGWSHDYWCYTIALESRDLWEPFVQAVERHGGERPYAAWRLTYQEPAFREIGNALTESDEWDEQGNPIGLCPVAENLQPRLLQLQTNNLESARQNRDALHKAIQEINGEPQGFTPSLMAGTAGAPCS